MIQICTATQLSSSFATLGTVGIPGAWKPGTVGNLTVYVKHTKHASQTNGYPVVKLRWKRLDTSGAMVDCHDPVLNSTLTTSGGVATVECDVPEYPLVPLKDSDGTVQYPLPVVAPTFATHVVLQAKQTGDTTNFGTLAADLTEIL